MENDFRKILLIRKKCLLKLSSVHYILFDNINIYLLLNSETLVTESAKRQLITNKWGSNPIISLNSLQFPRKYDFP